MLPILITIACGGLLELGSCFGIAVTLDTNAGHNRLMNTLSVWGLIAGALLFSAGVVWAAVALIVHIIRSIRGDS